MIFINCVYCYNKNRIFNIFNVIFNVVINLFSIKPIIYLLFTLFLFLLYTYISYNHINFYD